MSMTREEAIGKYGLGLVEKVEKADAEFFRTVNRGHFDGLVPDEDEYRASARDEDGNILFAYYYIPAGADPENHSGWEIDHYDD